LGTLLVDQVPTMPEQSSPLDPPVHARLQPKDRGFSDWAAALILAAGTIAVYRQTTLVPLLMDDRLAIADNPSIRGLWPIWPVLYPPDGAVVAGRPLLNLSYAINYALGGASVQGYHIFNLLVHALAAVTLFLVVRSILERPGLTERFGRYASELAFAVSAIWAWQPVQTESVTYISQRAESLMGLFYLLTLYCFIRGSESLGARGRISWFSGSVLACAAGLTTKEVAVTAPLIVLLYDRTFVSGSFSKAWRRNWPLYLALAATLALLWRRLTSLQGGTPVYDGIGFGGGLPWWRYGLGECRIVIKYILLSLWPIPLVFDYGKAVPNQLFEVWPYALLMAALVAFAITALWRWPAAGFAAVWFFLILAPSSSVIPIAGQPMAENRLYLPLAGIAALIVLLLFAKLGRRILPFLVCVAAVLGSASFQRNKVYLSEVSLWRDTAAKVPENARAHGNLANALSHIPGGANEAIDQYVTAIHYDPDTPELHNNLGNLLSRIPGRLDEGISQYEEALRLNPGDAQAHFNLAYALARVPERQDDAIAEYRKALRYNPGLLAAHYNLANALLRIPGRSIEAAAEYEATLQLKPDFFEARLGLAMAYLRTPGRMGQAREILLGAARLHPDDAEVRRLLAEIDSSDP
jgi:tetratricopeptide (TPR) repeat protein